MSWEKVRAALKRASQILFGPLGAILVIIAAGALLSLGVKNLQIGGLLGALLGRKQPGSKAIEAANSIPKDRIGQDGKLIPIGQADSKGVTQVAVVPIIDAGLFSNPDTVMFYDPQTAQSVEIALPDGVHSIDVEHVVVVQPGTFAVTVKDSSPVSGEQIDSLLSKYTT